MSQRELFFGTCELESLSKSPVVQEDTLEKLIMQNPNLLALPGENHRFFVVRNQFPISDEEVKNRYALDILLVRDDAVPVLVEVKRCVDTRIKREVVAQMLDYACYLQKANDIDLQKSFQSEADLTAPEATRCANDDAFWAKVSENLSSGKMILVFAADEMPKSLVDLIDFLQMSFPNKTVYGVEINEYTSSGQQTTVIERKIHYSPKQANGGKARPVPREWTGEMYLNHTKQYHPQLTKAVSEILEFFSDRYYTKFGKGQLTAIFLVYDKPSQNPIFSMDISQTTAMIWFYPHAKPFCDMLRTAEGRRHLPAGCQPKETPQYMKLDVHALADPNVRSWFCEEMTKLLKPE